MSISRKGGVAAILVIALLLRSLAFLATLPTGLVADEVEYHARSVAMTEGRETLGLGKRPPGCIWLYSAAQRVLGTERFAGRIANVLLGTLVVALVLLIGRRLGGNRTGLVAGAIAAVYPNFVFFSATLWNESLYLALVLPAILLLARAEESRWPARTIVAGTLLGLAALTRQVGVFFPLVAASWLLYRDVRSGRTAWRGFLLLASTALVIAPWTIAINRQPGPFALIARTNAMNLYIGNAPAQGVRHGMPRQAEYRKLSADRFERERLARELALQMIRDRLPWWPLEKLKEEIPILLAPTSVPVYRLLVDPETSTSARRWAYRYSAPFLGSHGLRLSAAIGAISAFVFVAAAGVGGLILLQGRTLGPLFWLFAGCHVGPTVATYAMTRYRLPIVAILIATAAWLLVDGRAAWRAASRRRRVAAVIGVAVTLGIIGLRWPDLQNVRWS